MKNIKTCQILAMVMEIYLTHGNRLLGIDRMKSKGAAWRSFAVNWAIES